MSAFSVVIYRKKGWEWEPGSPAFADRAWARGASALDFLIGRLDFVSSRLILLQEKEGISFNRRGKNPREEDAPADRTIFENLEELAQARKLAHLVLVDPRAIFLDARLLKRQTEEHLKRDADYTYPFDLPLGIGADVMSSRLLKRLAGLGELSEPQVSPWIGAHAGMAQSENLKIVNLDAGEAGIRERYPSGRALLDGEESWRRARRFAAGKKRGGTDALIRFWRERDAAGLARAKARVGQALAARPRRKDHRIPVCSLILTDGGFQSSATLAGIDAIAGSDPKRFRHTAILPFKGPAARRLEELGVPHEVSFSSWHNCFPANLDTLPRPAAVWTEISRLTGFFRKHGTRVLHAHTYYPPAWTAAQLLHIPVVFHCWGRPGGLPQSGPDGSRRWKKEALNFTWADRYIACSEWVAEGLQGSGLASERIRTLRHGLPLREWDPRRYAALEVRRELGLPLRELLIMVVGRLDLDRRLELLLAAFSRLRARFPRARLAFVGKPTDPDYGASLKRLVSVLGLEGRVRFLGYRPDVAKVLMAADVVVNPRTYDPFPRASMEAMAMERALVASRSGGMPEMARHMESALLAPPENPEGLSRALGLLLANPGLRARIGRRARVDALKNFRLDRFVSGIERTWMDLAASGPAAWN